MCVHATGEVDSFKLHCLAFVTKTTCQIWWKSVSNSVTVIVKENRWLSFILVFFCSTVCMSVLSRCGGRMTDWRGIRDALVIWGRSPCRRMKFGLPELCSIKGQHALSCFYRRHYTMHGGADLNLDRQHSVLPVYYSILRNIRQGYVFIGVCLFVSKITQKLIRPICTKFGEQIACGPLNWRLDYCGIVFVLCVSSCAFWFVCVCPHYFMFPWAVESSPLQFWR